MRRIAVVLGLAACRQVFGLEQPVHIDAAIASDAVDAAPDAPLLSFCPPPFNVISPTGPLYGHVQSDVDWPVALDDCIDDAAGTQGVYTHLAVFATEVERMQAHTLLPTTLWIGLSARVTPAQWKWITL